MRGEVVIGLTIFSLTAIRVDPIRSGPDFRSDKGLHIYSEYELSQTLDARATLSTGESLRRNFAVS
jgi:hypothetical protein